MSKARLTVYGASWCLDCRRVKRFLGQNRLDFDWVDIESQPSGMAFVRAATRGKQAIPTLALPDGSVLVQPTNRELAQSLALEDKARDPLYDLVIVGGGPAGLTAALYAAREGLETVVLEKGALGGQAATTEWIENYPGFPEGVGGMDLARRMEEQVRRFGVKLEYGEAQALEQEGRCRLVHTDAGEYSAWAVVIATGSSYRRLGVPGEDRFIGRGVHFCATCDGPFYKDQEILVIGGGNSAAEEGFYLTKYARKVTLVVRRGELGASQVLREKVLSSPKMGVIYHTEVVEFRGEKQLASVVLRRNQTGEEQEVRPRGVFVFIGLDPNSQWLQGSLDLDPFGFVKTGKTLETSRAGVYAAGDVRAGSTKQVASAAGEGVTAALMVRAYLQEK